MHADDSHNDKPGFFSKIFGHDDTAQMPVAAPTDAVVVDPATTDSASSETAVTPSDDVAAVAPAYADVELQSGSMSDVHAVPTGTGAALDLSASAVTQPAAEPAEPEVDSTEAGTFELPQLNTPVQPEVPVSVEEPVVSEAPTITTDAAPEANSEPDSKTEVLFDSTQPAVGASAEVTAPEPETAAPSVDVMPPAPPVAEGLAWTADKAKSDKPDDTETPESTDTTPSATDEVTQAELEGAQKDVDSILASHPDMTTDSTSKTTDAPVEPTSPISPPDKKASDESESTAAADQVSQRTATVARLQGHIDELETGLQKVRDELESLKG